MDIEQRKHQRVLGYAKAVHAATGTPGYIRDLSSTGCQVAFMQPLPVGRGDSVDIEIIAEHDPAIAPFAVRLTARWHKSDGIWFCIGGEVTTPAAGQERDSFAKLVSYYEQGP
jgi:hypothetical protein